MLGPATNADSRVLSVVALLSTERGTMSLGLDVDVDGWPSVKVGSGNQGSDDCFGQRLFDPDSLMFESMGTHIGWTGGDQKGVGDGSLDFGLFPDASGMGEQGSGALYVVPDDAPHCMDMYNDVLDAKPPMYDASETFRPLNHEGSFVGSSHDIVHGVLEKQTGQIGQSNESPRESSLTQYDAERDRVKKPNSAGDGKKMIHLVEGSRIAKRPPSSRNRTLPKRLADSVTHLPAARSMASGTLTKSVSSDQVSSSNIKNSRRVRGKDSKDVNSKNMTSRIATKPSQTIRATSAKTEMKGRPSFCELVSTGVMKPGVHKFSVGHVEVTATVGDDGAINYAGSRYRAVSKFALVVLRERNPSRQSCDGWKEVSWNGEKLDVLRSRASSIFLHNNGSV